MSTLKAEARERLVRAPVERVALSVGDRVKFAGEKQRYTVRAVSAEPEPAVEPIESLVERSSLGTLEARAARARVPEEMARAVVDTDHARRRLADCLVLAVLAEHGLVEREEQP